MSITFQAEVDFKEITARKVFLEDLYEGFDLETGGEYMSSYPDVFKDENGRLYEMRQIVDFEYEINLSNDNFYSVLQKIDHNLYVKTKSDGGFGSVSFEDLPSFRRKLIKACNITSSVGTRDSYVDGNFHYNGASSEYIIEKIKHMLTIIDNAQKRNIGIFWA